MKHFSRVPLAVLLLLIIILHGGLEVVGAVWQMHSALSSRLPSLAPEVQLVDSQKAESEVRILFQELKKDDPRLRVGRRLCCPSIKMETQGAKKPGCNCCTSGCRAGHRCRCGLPAGGVLEGLVLANSPCQSGSQEEASGLPSSVEFRFLPMEMEELKIVWVEVEERQMAGSGLGEYSIVDKLVVPPPEA